MDTFIATFLALAFVIGTLAVVAWVLFELSPFARHKDEFRDARTGQFKGESPHLE